MKSNGTMEGVYINGAPQGITFHETDNFTLYPASILSVNKNRFTKHYFLGDKRVASRIGTGLFNNVYGRNGSYVTAGQQDYAERMNQIQKQKEAYYKQQGIAPGVPTMKGAYGDPENTGVGYNAVLTELGNRDVPQGWIQTPRPNTTPNTNPGPPVSWNDPSNPDAPQAGYGYIPNDTTKEETFFYHSDHLGSTSYITDAKANITQFDAYLPYGELLVDEHSSSEELPYKFNGKQFDEETGLYYYGARYMNPMASIWYGMGPLSEKYPYIGGVVYCEGNPVVQIDDFGLAPKKPKRKVNNNSNQFNPLNAPTYEIGGIIYRGGQMVGEKPLEPDYTIETLLIGGLSSVRVGSIARSTFSRIKNLFSGGSGKVSKRGSLRPTLSKKNQNINQNGSLGSSLPIFKKWLKGVDRLDRDQIVRDLRRLGFKKVYDGKGMIHMERGGIKIRLDPPQHGTEYNHMHINYGRGNKNTYDVNLHSVDYRSPAARIKIK